MRRAADTLRLTATLSLIPASVNDGGVGFAVMFLVLGGCMVPRAARCTPGFDSAFCAVMLFAGWAALADWYLRVPGLDLAVHALATGLIGALAAHVSYALALLAPSDLPRRARIGTAALSTSAAALLAVVWEFGEWAGHTYINSAIQVGYSDTVTDLAAGTLGGLIAGLLAAPALVRAHRTTHESRDRNPQ